MPECPILQEMIDDAECRDICFEADKEAKTKTMVTKKIKRIICWKGICKSCKLHTAK